MIRHWLGDMVEKLLLLIRRKDFPDGVLIVYVPKVSFKLKDVPKKGVE